MFTNADAFTCALVIVRAMRSARSGSARSGSVAASAPAILASASALPDSYVIVRAVRSASFRMRAARDESVRAGSGFLRAAPPVPLPSGRVLRASGLVRAAVFAVNGNLHNGNTWVIAAIVVQLPCCPSPVACLLYTSDAADDLLCVDLGGRRIIKKKK